MHEGPRRWNSGISTLSARIPLARTPLMPVNSIPETLLDASALTEKIDSLAHAMAGIVDDPDQAALVGIRTRGVTLARRIHTVFRETRGWDLPIGILDITLYRDDLSQLAAYPLVRKTDLDFDVQDKTILLIDDVIYTGWFYPAHRRFTFCLPQTVASLTEKPLHVSLIPPHLLEDDR